jgi:Tol biopolymer transport system component
MADLRIALKELKEESESGITGAVPQAPVASSRKWLWIAAGVVLLTGGGGMAYVFSGGKSVASPALRETILTSYPGIERSPTFSPDGNQVAFVWNGEQGTNHDIYVKIVGTAKPLRLTTDPAVDYSPAWSPDGRSIAFIRNDAILLVPPLGGPEREVARDLFPPVDGPITSLVYAINWSPDGRWIVAGGREAGKGGNAIFLVSVETGEKRRLTSPPQLAGGDYFPAISPDGRTLAFVRMAVLGSSIMSDGDIYTVNLDKNNLTAGEPRRVTSERVFIYGVTWTADGKQLVFSAMHGDAPSLWRVGASGAEKPEKLPIGDSAMWPAISRQGNRLAFEKALSTDLNIWRLSLTEPEKAPVSLIASTRAEMSARYSPDGTRIAFSSERSGMSEIWIANADGSNPVELTTSGNSGSPAWSPDGQWITYDSIANSRWQVFTISSRGGRPQQITFDNSHTRPSWSHDGKWIFATGGGGIQKIPAHGGTPIQLTRSGGTIPVPSVDDQYVYFQKERFIWKVSADGGTESKVAGGTIPSLGMDVTRDGLYYALREGDRWTFQFMDLATGRSRRVRNTDKPPSLGLSASPDGAWVLYTQVDREASGDLMLVDGFR